MPESEILLKYTTDQSSLSKTLSSGERITSAQRAYNLEVREAKSQLVKTERALQDYKDEVDALTQAENAAAEATRRRTQAQSQTPSSIGGGGGAPGEGRFEDVSRQTALLGDTESQIRTLTGALGYMGGAAGQTAEQVINIGAELFAVGEAGPKLVAALGDIATNITTSIPLLGSLATHLVALVPALGATGAAIAAVAAPVAAVVAVIAGLVLAIKSIGDAAEEARKQVEEQYNASKKRIEIEREIADFQREGDKQGAQARLDELKRQQEDADKLLTELYVARDRINKAYEELGAAINPEERAKLGAQGQELDKEIEAEQKLFDERAKETAALEAAIPGIQDARAEERALAETRDNASSAIDAANKAEQSRQKAIDDAQHQIEQAQQKAQAAQDNYNKAVEDAGRTARNAAADIRTKLGDALKDLVTKTRRQAIDDTIKQNADAADLRLKQFRAEQDALQAHGRALRDILKNANRSQEDLLKERDFLALENLSKGTERQLEDANQAARDAQHDRDIANRREVQDFQTQVMRLRTERLNDYQRQQVDLRTNATRELRDAQIAKQRALQQAHEALNRELEIARRGQNAMLDQTAKFWQSMVALVPAGGGGSSTAARQDMRNIALDVFQDVRRR
jgi:hypothetical protein